MRALLPGRPQSHLRGEHQRRVLGAGALLAVSGVLVQAVASGRPVVATAFPHAVDLLGSGAGIVVSHDDPDEMENALRRILTDPRLSGEMAAEGRRLAPTMTWSVVAEKYQALAHLLMREQRARM